MLLAQKRRLGMFGIIMALALPTMLEQLMHTAVQYIDTAMVGVLGTQATAAVGSTSTISWLVGSTTSALGVGFLSYIAKSIGAKKFDDARRASAQAVFVVLTVGTLLTVITLSLSKAIPILMNVDESVRDLSAKYFFILYLPMLPRTASTIFGMVLRSSGDTKTPMLVGIGVNLTNVILNFLLIYPTRMISVFNWQFNIWGADMGVRGAAVASAIAFTFGGILITIVLFCHKKISPKGSIKPDKDILAPCFKVALPNMFQRFLTSSGYVVFASMINSVGDVATAAHTIANTVESAFYIPGYGMNTAAATLVGNAYGAKDRAQLDKVTKMFIPIEIILMIISGTLLLIFAPSLMAIFSESDEVINLGATVLRMVAVSEPFYGFSIIAEGFLLVVSNTKTPFKYNIIGMWGVRILGTFILIRLCHFGLIAAWAAMIMHNLLIFVLYLACYSRKKWIPESIR